MPWFRYYSEIYNLIGDDTVLRNTVSEAVSSYLQIILVTKYVMTQMMRVLLNTWPLKANIG